MPVSERFFGVSNLGLIFKGRSLLNVSRL